MVLALSVRKSGVYLIKSIDKEIFSMAYKLARSLIKQYSSERFSAFYIKSLYAKGLASLSGNIIKYNTEYAQAIMTLLKLI